MKLTVDKIWATQEGETPIIATAIHDGHLLRHELKPLLKLTDEERLREEDPFTSKLTEIVDVRVVGLRSRFEIDLNRPREKAVYLKPEDAWGLNLYHEPLPVEVVNKSLAEYDAFYSAMKEFFNDKVKRFGKFVVLDFHTYNHRRDGADAAPATLEENPEVNIGTRTMKDRSVWANIIDGFIEDLSTFDYNDRRLDVRENIKFFGGQFPRWIHSNFPENACVLSIEFKKFFMDEWTGQLDKEQFKLIQAALKSTLPRILDNLNLNTGGTHA